MANALASNRVVGRFRPHWLSSIYIREADYSCAERWKAGDHCGSLIELARFGRRELILIESKGFCGTQSTLQEALISVRSSIPATS